MPDADVIPIGGQPDRRKREAAAATPDDTPEPSDVEGPLGTRGRPGRGSGGPRPSSASRGLAAGGSADSPRPPRRRAAPTEPPPAPPTFGDDEVGPVRPVRRRGPRPTDRGPQPADPPPVEETPAPASPAAGAAGATAASTATTGPSADDAGTRSDVAFVDPRHPSAPSGGIPVVDWISGFTSAAVELFGADWEPRLAEFLAFLRRRLTGDYEVDEYGFDAEITERFLLAAVRPVAEKWFRVEVRGIENVPTEGGALMVSNHSGTVPVDGLVTATALYDHTGRHLRPLGADLVFSLPFIGELARKGGATLACNEDAERMLRGGEMVGVWPEGFKGIGKPFSERYKLQRFGRGGFVAAAMRTGVPIVPVSVVGAEEIYPLVANVPSLARLLGLPYLPITPLFPLLGPLGLVPLPSKWLIEFGEPIRTDSYDASAADDPMLVFNVTDQVRETIQQTLYSLLDQRAGVFAP